MDSRLDRHVVGGARLSAVFEHESFENADFESFENIESAG
jgi:hypothetical protein